MVFPLYSGTDFGWFLRNSDNRTLMQFSFHPVIKVRAGTTIDMITDEDRLDHYKLFASRFEVVG